MDRSISSDYQNKLEQSVLAVLIMDTKEVSSTSDIEHLFCIPHHVEIYKAIKKSISSGVLDWMELYKYVSEYNFDYAFKLQDSYVSSSNYQSDVAKLEDSYRRRKALEISEKLGNGDISFDEYCSMITALDSEYISMSSNNSVDPTDIAQLLTSKNEVLRFRRFKGTQEALNLEKNTIVVISARPSVGKSAFALNLFNDLSSDDEYRCIYINMEMTERQVWERLVAIESDTYISNFKNAEPGTKVYSTILETVELINNRDIYIINKPVTISYIEKLMQSEKRRKANVGKHIIYFFDYLGYIGLKGKKDNVEKFGEIVRQLQIFSKEYQCTIFLLAQINRDGAKAPKIENLKDTGELEQSAHAVLILEDMDENEAKLLTHRIKVKVAKNRTGFKNGNLNYLYIRDKQKFVETKKKENS